MDPFKSKKRKATEDPIFPLDELNQDLLERVLAWVPPSSFFRLRSVCKKWSSVFSSPTFHIACSRIPQREPWFLMVDQDSDSDSDQSSIFFDTTEGNWKNLNHLNGINHPFNSQNPVPVASSGGLICYKTTNFDLLVSNPITGVNRKLPPVSRITENQNLHAIAMDCSTKDPSSYRVVLVFGEFSNLSFMVYDSAKDTWQEEVGLVRKTESSSEDSTVIEDDTVYFLSKAGDVVSTNMQRSPSKQYSSVLVTEEREKVVYFLSHSGTIVSCNLYQKSFFELPRILPVYFEYSIDLVESNGEMLVIVLSEFLGTASLRVWRFCKENREWYQVSALPPSISHEFYGKKVDINCVGHGDLIFICVNSSEFSNCFMCNLENNQWFELPKCYINGKAKEFLSAFSFEPRVEAVA